MNDDTVRAIIIGVVLGTIGLICCIMLMVMLAKRKKPRQDNRLPAFHPAPAKTEVIQSKSNKIWLTSPASPPASSAQNGAIRATCGGAGGRDGGCGAANDGGWRAGGSRSTCGNGKSSSDSDI